MRFQCNAPGFTLLELLISVSILTLISTATVFSLRASREREELNVAVRILSGDLRNVQARALAARNVQTCETVEGPRVCEAENTSPQICISSCAPLPPTTFGVSLKPQSIGYTVFAEVDSKIQDWRLNDIRELLFTRDLNPLGGGRVVIESLSPSKHEVLPHADVAFHRQNGVMRIEACGDAGMPPCGISEPSRLSITLRHVGSGATRSIELNALSGRISGDP